MPEKYNGWKNYETWNVALYICNEYELYLKAKHFMEKLNKRDWNRENAYRQFVEAVHLKKQSTPDGVKYLSDVLDYAELDEMMWDLIDAKEKPDEHEQAAG